MNCRSTFKALNLCQPSDNRSFQSYSRLSFSSLAALPRSELHYSPSHVGPPHIEECESATFSIFWVCHLLHSVTIAFRATKILTTVGVNIPVDRSFQSYQNTINFKNWYFYSFQSYLTRGRHYALRQLQGLTT